MRLPGFTAQATLCRSNHYSNSAESGPNSSGSLVAAALDPVECNMFRGDCLQGCYFRKGWAAQFCRDSCQALFEECLEGSCLSSGKGWCSATCVDLQTDANNCGRCGNACESGLVCSNGNCSGCESGLTNCSGTCVDLQTDPNNCGSCNTPCGANCQFCQDGVCKNYPCYPNCC